MPFKTIINGVGTDRCWCLLWLLAGVTSINWVASPTVGLDTDWCCWMFGKGWPWFCEGTLTDCYFKILMILGLYTSLLG